MFFVCIFLLAKSYFSLYLSLFVFFFFLTLNLLDYLQCRDFDLFFCLVWSDLFDLLHLLFVFLFVCVCDSSSYMLSHLSWHSALRALVCPRSIELKDLHGSAHNLDVKVLGLEETWNTPSLLLANSVKSGGTAVFSQVTKYIESMLIYKISLFLKFNIFVL